jgi:hypothetical protein
MVGIPKFRNFFQKILSPTMMSSFALFELPFGFFFPFKKNDQNLVFFFVYFGLVFEKRHQGGRQCDKKSSVEAL